jgi:hypothetical protein
MSHITDAQLEIWLDSWAKWVRGGCSIAALGYKPQSIDQDFIQSNSSDNTSVFNHDIETLIDKGVNALAGRDRLAADVGRFEYGARHESFNPTYDRVPTIAVKAARLTEYMHSRNLLPKNKTIGIPTYKRKLADFKLVVWSGVVVSVDMKTAA